MRVKCIHGYFIFEETTFGQISDFMRYSGFDLVPKENYFTFKELENAPDYALAGKNYLGYPATKTFEGKPWEIFEAQNVVYNFGLNKVLPLLTTVQRVEVFEASGYYISKGLIIPGSLDQRGNRIKGFTAWFSRAKLNWIYSELTYV